MHVEVTKVTTTYVDLRIGVQELRVLVHRLAEDGSYIHGQARKLLPENHEEIAEEISDKLRTVHYRLREEDA